MTMKFYFIFCLVLATFMNSLFKIDNFEPFFSLQNVTTFVYFPHKNLLLLVFPIKVRILCIDSL
jgi:hypothetical protein